MGDNRIEVTAATAEGAKATATIDVVYNPGLGMSALGLTPSDLFVDTTTQVQASIAIDDVPSLQHDGVTLHRVDAAGADLGVVATLADGGVQGGRRTFAGTFTLALQAPQTLRYRVVATTSGGQALSEIRQVRAIRPIAQADAQAALDALDEAARVYKAKQAKTASSQAGMSAVLATLAANPAVDAVVGFDLDTDATVYFKSGLVGIFDTLAPDTRGGGAPGVPGWFAGPRAAASQDDLLGFDALSGCGFSGDFGTSDESSYVKDALERIKCLSACRRADADCGLAFFSSFADKRVAYYSGHGVKMKDRDFDWAAISASFPKTFDGEDAAVVASYAYQTPVTVTGELASAQALATLPASYAAEAASHDVVLVKDA